MCARKRREPKPVIPQKEVSIEEQWLNFATESFVGENFFTGEKKSAGGGRLRLDKYTLNRMLQNPCANYDKLQQISAWFEQTSGIYNRLLNYFTNMLTFDHVLMTNVPSSLISKYKKEIKESYDSSATLLQKIRVKDSLAKFSKDYWRDGEGYYYKIADKTGVVYQKIPNKICLPSKNTNGVLGFVVDMDALDSYDVTVFPKEIQKAYALFRINRKHEKFIFEKWFQISKNGFCFSNNEDGHGTPPLLFLFKDLLGLEDTKDLQDKLDKLNNIKMIHNKIEKDKEGRIAVDPKVAQRYVGAIKENLKQRGLDEGD